MSTTTEAAPTAPKRETAEPAVSVHHDSQEEYESAEEIEGEYDEEEIEEIEIEEVEEEEEVEELEDEEEEEEDEEGLEQKQKEKPLDDDEDRKNPQFIPKKGYFYEHDDRTKAEEENGEEVEEPPKKEEKPKKPADSVDKWSHDKFDESEQAPKSREELQTTYGYDIRNEDQPPRARRRRRYGRGPTKYTRRWEEEEAYQKPRGGFRGRGGRGSSRGTGRERRRDSKDEYDEEFPELGDASTRTSQPVGLDKPEKSEMKSSTNKLNTSVPPQPSQPQPAIKRDLPPRDRDNKEQPQGRRDGGNRGAGHMERNRDNNPHPAPSRREGRPIGREQDRDNENYTRGGRGRGGGVGGNNRRGRRSEFTNRNRYPNRRDNREDGEMNDYPSLSNSNNVPKNVGGGVGNNSRSSYNNSYENSRDRDYGGPKPRPDNRRVEHKEYRAIVNGTSNEPKQKSFGNETKHDKQPPHQHYQQPQPQQHRIPPFTNTEYPGPGKGNINSNSRPGPPNSNRSQANDRQNNVYSETHDEKHRESSHEASGSEPPQKEVRDLREKLNAIRMQKGYQNQNQNDRRNQMPPRLQQQQQQQNQQQPPQPQMDPSSKPRRYSTQRERPVQQPTIVTSGGMVLPNTVAPAIAQGVPNMVPVVTMADGVVPSTVAAYQPTTYYEGTQVYEASGSPVTGSGPSVSPSLWNPHASAYATAPYPSPPTAPQVPQPPYADPTAFIGPGGPAIYAAPPQFLQDPTLINYSGPAPPFPPPYHAHPQGFQGYAQVTPAPPPEVYHAGVTYYSTQNQIQRPPMMAPQKRPKSVLQLVEPPEKAKEKGPKDPLHTEQPSNELVGMNPIPENPSEDELSKKLEETSLEPRQNVERKPTPEITSWAAEMEQLNSPTSCYPDEDHFGIVNDESSKCDPTVKELQGGQSAKDSASNQKETSEEVKTDNEKKEAASTTE